MNWKINCKKRVQKKYSSFSGIKILPPSLSFLFPIITCTKKVPRGYNTRSIQDVTPKVKTKTKKGEMPKMQEISGVQERKMIRTD
jgi:hypothetical protein